MTYVGAKLDHPVKVILIYIYIYLASSIHKIGIYVDE